MSDHFSLSSEVSERITGHVKVIWHYNMELLSQVYHTITEQRYILDELGQQNRTHSS